MRSNDSTWRAAETHTVLLDELEKIRKEEGAESLTEVTKDMHMYPDLHGARRTHTRTCIGIADEHSAQETARPSQTRACADPSSASRS